MKLWATNYYKYLLTILNQHIMSKLTKKAGLDIAMHKQIVNGEGRYIVPVKNVARNSKNRFIINTNCCTVKQLNNFKKNIENPEVDVQFELNRCQLSFFQADNEKAFTPKKGQFIAIIVEEIPVKRGTDRDYRIIGVEPLETKQTVPAYQELADKGELTPPTPTEIAKADAEELGIETAIEREIINEDVSIEDLPIQAHQD